MYPAWSNSRYRLFSSKTSGVSVNDKSYKVDIRDWVKISRHTSRFVRSWETYAVKTMENQSYKPFKNYFLVYSLIYFAVVCWIPTFLKQTSQFFQIFDCYKKKRRRRSWSRSLLYSVLKHCMLELFTRKYF